MNLRLKALNSIKPESKAKKITWSTLKGVNENYTPLWNDREKRQTIHGVSPQTRSGIRYFVVLFPVMPILLLTVIETGKSSAGYIRCLM